MLKLNIIPENQKKDIKLRIIYDLIKNILMIILIFLLASIIALKLMEMMITNHYIYTIEQSGILSKSSENYSRKVSEINSQIEAVEDIQRGYVEWSKTIDYLNEQTPEGIILNRITLNKQKNEATLAGSAKTRDSLLVFKENLEKSGYFEKFDLPIKTLLQKENIQFSFTIKILKYEY